MAVAAQHSSLSAQILRPIYALFKDHPAELKMLQSKLSLPAAERIGEESERLALSQIYGLLSEIGIAQGYQDIGLRIGAKLPVGCFGSLSFLMIASATLRDLLDNYCRYYGVIIHGVDMPRWQQLGDELYIDFPLPSQDEIVDIKADLILAGCYSLINHALNYHFFPTRIEVCGSGGEYQHRYADWLNCSTVTFNKPNLRIYAKAELLDKPLPGANHSLCRVFRKELDMFLKQLNTEQTIIDQIQQILATTENLGKVTLTSMASALALGERTFSRQLAEYNVSFRELLANYKSTRAIRLLADGKTVDEVSFYLGFSERAAFDRAFKKWQGVTASRFQEDYQFSGTGDFDINDDAQLPNLPIVANQILDMINAGNYQMDALAAIVERDPSLTTKLLALANSAVYGVAAVATIKEAVVRVFGVDTLRNLALAMLANECFVTNRCSGFSLKKYWLNALATGQLAADVAKLSGCADPGQAYLLGLLHNIGTLLLVQRRPVDMNEVFQQQGLELASLAEICAAEKRLLGVDACSAGATLAAFWNLPRYLAVSIRGLLNDGYQGEASELVHLVAAVEHVVRVLPANGALLSPVQQRLQSVAGLESQQIHDLLAEFRIKLDIIRVAAEQLS
ncbi:HDOD domain-containing protein [Oceanicoccus sp. KOV_DT_Chl]|uniref:HDOD domain-containing protein n=1 Tax=Oceanicoccus sp. KOV_DT_Chl TaxID=1904639 RepID=UPI000C7C9A5F|nr:HDOD domain-containing protein [Oceanicoccus sp. KOV_DT_Chl]